MVKKQKQETSSSSAPNSFEERNKKFKEDRQARLYCLIGECDKRIDTLNTQISNKEKNAEELKVERAEQQKIKAEHQTELAALENELKQLNQPVPEPCRFFFSLKKNKTNYY